MDPLLSAVFTKRLLKADDWRVMQAGSSVPLHTLRRVHLHSQGVEVSPLADQALRVLACPTVGRLQALRTALRCVATPGLQAQAGSHGELGLLMLATHVEIMSNKQDHVLSARQDLIKRLEPHGVSITQAWDAAWISLAARRVKPYASTFGRGNHLSFDRAWSKWASSSTGTDPWVVPTPPLTDQRRMVESQIKQGQGGNWITEGGWRLDWLVAHMAPDWVAQGLDEQVRSALLAWTGEVAFAAGIGRSPPQSKALDDDCLADSLNALSATLGRTVDLDWSLPGLSVWLPKCLARHRALSSPILPTSIHHRRHRSRV